MSEEVENGSTGMDCQNSEELDEKGAVSANGMDGQQENSNFKVDNASNHQTEPDIETERDNQEPLESEETSGVVPSELAPKSEESPESSPTHAQAAPSPMDPCSEPSSCESADKAASSECESASGQDLTPAYSDISLSSGSDAAAIPSPQLIPSQASSAVTSPRDSPCRKQPTNNTADIESDLLQELDSELNENLPNESKIPNGLKQTVAVAELPEYKALKSRYEMLQNSFVEKELDNSRLKDEQAAAARRAEAAEQEAAFSRQRLDELAQGGEATQQLERRVRELVEEARRGEERLAARDAAAKRSLAALQADAAAKLQQVTKQYEESRREKEAMVMRYAMAEQKNIKASEDVLKAEQRVKEMQRERELMIKKYHYTKTEKLKTDEESQARVAELTALRKELEKQRELVSSHAVKSKWAENKLKAESDQHKEAKARLGELQRQLKQAREEAEQVRRDCQGMIKTYQENETERSVELEGTLRRREEELEQRRLEQGDQQEVHTIVRHQLDNLKRKHKEIIEELKTYRDKVRSQDLEREHQEASLNKYRETLQNQKKEITDMHEQLASLKDVDVRLKEEQQQSAGLVERLAELEDNSRDLVSDMEGCASREAQQLSLQQKMSDTNARLVAENSTLSNRLSALTADADLTKEKVTTLEDKVKQLSATLSREQQERADQTQQLEVKVSAATQRATQLKQEVDDGQDEIRTLKRRHANNIKDLSRQLQQAKKRLEQADHSGGSGPRGDAASQGSMGSRTSSQGSLDTLGRDQRAASAEPQHREVEEPTVQVVEVDKQLLMEKIVRLQKAHARKNDKLEFMEDHINQLLREVKRKTRIIQNYAMRDEAGALAPPTMDYAKAQLAKKSGGIMAAMYNGHQAGGEVTLDLSLEINHKLQALLEDTLLKNITLKENLDTLGEEIARLSQENRQIQLQLQQR